MGKSIVTQVIDALTAAGIRAERGFPGQKMPALTAPGAAVSLEALDQDAGTVTVQTAVLCPAVLGGGVCEDTAVLVCRVLGALGARCVQGSCRHVSLTELLQVDVSAVFRGQEGEDGFSRLSVTAGGTTLPWAEEFRSWRSGDDTTALTSAVWKFRLEERLPPDAAEGSAPAEPFTLVVTRDGGTETYSGCALTFCRQETTAAGLYRIRQGTAQSRTVTA